MCIQYNLKYQLKFSITVANVSVLTLSVTAVISVIISLASQEVFLASNELVIVTWSVTPNLFHCYYSVYLQQCM
jgi:hypothetical protein